MRNERTDSDHIRLQFLHEEEIIQEIIGCLTRCTDHHAGTNLIADFLQIQEASHTIQKGLCFRMKLPVQRERSSLMPQQIPVSTGIVISLIRFSALFPDR